MIIMMLKHLQFVQLYYYRSIMATTIFWDAAPKLTHHWSNASWVAGLLQANPCSRYCICVISVPLNINTNPVTNCVALLRHKHLMWSHRCKLLWQCWLNIGPSSTTLAQHWNDLAQWLVYAAAVQVITSRWLCDLKHDLLSVTNLAQKAILFKIGHLVKMKLKRSASKLFQIIKASQLCLDI